jgi:prolyl-tRNA synthetase
MVPAKDGEDVVLVCPQCKVAKTFKEGDAHTCSKCNAKADTINTIEIGHIFKLGIKYSVALGAHFIDSQGKQKPIIMGCYGIGVSRLIAAIIEQNNDGTGIVWPDEVSPFKAIILPLDTTDQKIMRAAQELYVHLVSSGMEVLLDDRDERAGVKFKDADLLGISYQVIIGKEFLKTSAFELKHRRSGKKSIGTKEEIIREIQTVK